LRYTTEKAEQVIMRIRGRITLYSLIIVASLSLTEPIGARQSNNIRPIDTDALKQMVRVDGRHVLVFMAAWCQPCIKELPDINALYEKYRARNLKVIGVSVDFEGPAAMQPILNRLKVNFPVYWSGEAAIDEYDIRGIPYIIFIRNGVIVERILGQRTKEYLDKKFEAFLTDP
jgi:thiol-disulfide isomerase/thioredoxin